MPMNTKRWLFASLGTFAVIFILEMIIHGVLLEGIYKQTASVWRPEADIQRLMWLMWLGYLIFAPFFALIYIKGYEEGKVCVGQGIRYGIYMGFVLSASQSLGRYVGVPIPAFLAFYWFEVVMGES